MNGVTSYDVLFQLLSSSLLLLLLYIKLFSLHLFFSLVFQLVAMIDKKVNGVNSFSGPYWLSRTVFENIKTLKTILFFELNVIGVFQEKKKTGNQICSPSLLYLRKRTTYSFQKQASNLFLLFIVLKLNSAFDNDQNPVLMDMI